MEQTQSSLAARRAEALATVYLTTRPDVQAFGLGDRKAVDLFARIERDDGRPGAIFGVIVRGTAKALPTPRAADVYLAMVFKRFEKGPPLSVPVLILTFSMHDDAGYVTWMAEPSGRGDAPKLIIHVHPKSVRATRDTLDDIVEKVNAWYDRVEKTMFIHAAV
jgi:hypothetical protein